jgi:hydroxyacylglutathione hydrolase
MVASLAKLTALSGETRICCGHEYALANLRFAVAVEPESAALRDRLRHGQGKRAAGCPQCRRSLPTTVRPIRPSAK